MYYNPTLPYGGLGYTPNTNFGAYNAQTVQPVANQPQPIGQQPVEDGIRRVHGREGATTFGNSLGANRSALVVDETEVDVIWCIVTDGGGFPTLKRLKFVIDDGGQKPVIEENKPRVLKPSAKYATKKDLDELKKRFERLEEALGEEPNSEHAESAKSNAKGK